MATTRQVAVACAKVCDDKKATDILILDVRKLTYITDYFVVCSTSNERQARAITDELREEMKKHNLRQLGLEGIGEARWILQDFADVVIHVFHESQREFYDIEGLWADAPRVRWQKSRSKA